MFTVQLALSFTFFSKWLVLYKSAFAYLLTLLTCSLSIKLWLRLPHNFFFFLLLMTALATRWILHPLTTESRQTDKVHKGANL